MSLENWRKLMDENDLKYFNEYQRSSNLDIERMREDWKALRRFALNKLNISLNDSGRPGQLLNIDVSDDELCPYLSDYSKKIFFKYSRILDFKDGYKPKNMILIKNILK